MLSYELAKELKDAGFPQDATYDIARQIKDGVKYPTLSELIDASGDRFMSVNKNFFPRPEKYFASASKDGGGMNQFGDTPEEAVAKLWIELQK